MILNRARAVLIAAALAFAPGAAAQDQSFAVLVYRDHFEVRGNRFESADDLRNYLEALSEFTSRIHIRECGADERVREAVEVIRALAARKAAAAGPSPFMAFDFASVACPRP